MEVEVTIRAQQELRKRNYQDYKYALLKLVDVNWSGPVLVVTRENDLNEDHYEIVEEAGYKFAVIKNIANAYQYFTVDYFPNGFAKGLRVDVA